jgi:hypothetical protein
MVVAAVEPPWLHTLGQIAGVILVVELSLALIITCAFIIALAVGARWLHVRALPPLREYLPRAQEAMSVTERSSDTVVNGIAEFYGRRQAVQTGLRVLLFGKRDVETFREEQQIYADEELQRIEPPATLPGLDIPPAETGTTRQGGNALAAGPLPAHNGDIRRGAGIPDTDDNNPDRL